MKFKFLIIGEFKCNGDFGVEKLLNKIYKINKYNKLVRPTAKNTTLTEVHTDLKILQIDLVNHYLLKNFIDLMKIDLNKKRYLFKNEKYQELISTVWIEMVSVILNILFSAKYFPVEIKNS